MGKPIDEVIETVQDAKKAMLLEEEATMRTEAQAAKPAEVIEAKKES